jgi:hypothetical protein
MNGKSDSECATQAVRESNWTAACECLGLPRRNPARERGHRS